MGTQQKELEEWTQRLLQAFELDGTQVDMDAVLDLAAAAAHSVVRPAAPLTTFVAGLAAGLAAGSGQADENVAMRAAIRAAQRECDAEADRKESK